MIKINENFLKLKQNYLFIEIAKRLKAFSAENPDKPLIRMGIGDVTLPLPAAAVEAMKKAADEMGVKETFRGYEDTGRGYDFLKEKIKAYYNENGAEISLDEILVNDGAKSDSGNISDIFSESNTVLITDPAYPVYVDSTIMAGKQIIFAAATSENGFKALPDYNIDCEMIYLCSPNNPTGSVYTAEELKMWVDYANEKHAIIIFDAAYEAFIRDKSLPRSIMAIPGARTCAVELCSLSKTAGFTGTRLGYTIIPNELMAYSENGEKVSVLKTWIRRQGSKFNGVSYPVQRAAEAVFSTDGRAQIQANIDYYMKNAEIISNTCETLNIPYTGGKNSPYIWLKAPNGMSGWDFFDYLLNEIQVVGTPGEGFGENGGGWFRLTSFNTHENTAEAMKRVEKLLS
ncbi:MAG: LL-diaminopimelate aminotransferase [Ruminococcus sp.]|jgi:LL-diaminopimelate aminotransferase|nr:LL-diaminopimelate aminotransferase [Ruminococcus sp.]